MLNKVWFWLLFLGIVYGFFKAAYQTATAPIATIEANVAAPSTDEGDTAPDDAAFRDDVGLTAMGKRLNEAVLDAAKTTVEICIFLIGIMALWLGLLNIARDSGLVDAFARLLRPLMRLVFPEVPDGHPAQGAMLMNLSANMLGLDNAATPMGLKAMQELQKLNPTEDTATNSMAMFLAVNTSSITLVPFTIIGYRMIKGSEDPAAPIAGTLVATFISTLAAVIITRWMSRWRRFRVVDSATGNEQLSDRPVSPDGD